MKRSELIQLVLDSVCGSYELNEDKVSDILSILEEAKVILPPEIKNPKYVNIYSSYHHWCDDWAHNNAYGGNLRLDPYYLNEWEPEDE